jgi:predicted kinase
MAIPPLVFVEGMTGAGKSTTAAHIAEWLASRGVRARSYHEMDDDNPIRTRGVDAMLANHPHRPPPPDVGPDGFARDPSVYAVTQWGALASRCAERGETVVLESRYQQNSVQPRYLGGAPASKVLAGFREIEAQVAPFAPLLVYLSPRDVRGHLRRTLETRDEAWARWLVASFSGFGWVKARGLTGEEAVFAFYEAWEALAVELFALHTGAKLWIEDPHADWEAARDRIHAMLSDWCEPSP